MAQFRQLRLPHSSACLLQPDGAVLHAGDAASAARTLAEKAGVASRVRGGCRAVQLQGREVCALVEWHSCC